MELKERLGALETMLFAMGDAVPVEHLAQALEVDEKTVRKDLEILSESYAAQDRGLRLIYLEDSVQLSTKSEYYEPLIRLAKTPRKPVLSDTVLETLSIIAYKQPVTKAEVAAIRGVNSDFAVDRLVQFGLIRELGRKDAPGRPILFGTTEQFLRSFDVRSVSELPTISPVQVEEFKSEAEAEARSQLGV